MLQSQFVLFALKQTEATMWDNNQLETTLTTIISRERTRELGIKKVRLQKKSPRPVVKTTESGIEEDHSEEKINDKAENIEEESIPENAPLKGQMKKDKEKKAIIISTRAMLETM